MTQIEDAIEQANAALSFLAGVDRATLPDTELVALMRSDEQLGRFCDTSRVLDAGEVAERSRYDLGAEGLSMRLGERKPALFVEQITLVSAAEAARRIRIGTAIRPRATLLGEVLPAERPILAEAMTAGLVGVDAAHAILGSLKQAETGSEATPDNMDAAELTLVEAAVHDSADLVLDAGRLWRDALDPEGVEPRYEEIRERRMLTIGRERNGIKKYTINASPTMSAALDAVLLDSMDPGVGPRFLSEEDQARAEVELVDINGEIAERIIDPRSLEQKRHDILEGVLTAGLRATREGPTNMRTVGNVTAIVGLEDLQAGTGFGILEGIDEVIPVTAIQEMVCESGYQMIVTSSKGKLVYESAVLRCFTQSQRRVMIARDGDRCIVPGCRCRAAATNAHHVVFWRNGGKTEIGNGVLLCPAHHHALHQGAFEIKMVDGLPYIRAGIDSTNESAWRPANRSRLIVAAA